MPYPMADQCTGRHLNTASGRPDPSLVNQELEEGLRAVAAPIRDPDGRVIAAVNISAHATRTLESMRRDLLPPLLTTAARIETDLKAAHPRRPKIASI